MGDDEEAPPPFADPDLALVGALVGEWESRSATTLSKGMERLFSDAPVSVYPNDWPEGYCPQHSEFHICWHCHDMHRVRVTEDRQDERWGKGQPCPECREGAASGPAIDIEAELKRMRVPRKFWAESISTWTPADGPPRAACINYVASWPPALPMLFFTGGVGTGKTHLSVGVLRALFEQHGKRGQFYATIDLLDRYKATFDADRATETVDAVDSALRKTPLLVLDDWGTERATDWAQERLFHLVDERYRERLPLIITTNADLMDMPKRIVSRLADAQECQRLYFGGRDMRAVQR